MHHECPMRSHELSPSWWLQRNQASWTLTLPRELQQKCLLSTMTRNTARTRRRTTPKISRTACEANHVEGRFYCEGEGTIPSSQHPREPSRRPSRRCHPKVAQRAFMKKHKSVNKKVSKVNKVGANAEKGSQVSEQLEEVEKSKKPNNK